ncbi:hypothetical protein CEE37_01475 [candidate division LCP-89 bacterium B3_LCP]|uniref:TonB C-terminal domain-containing protein n=1 Tax=candidate division LCP-89 bacterium B3_LCP TaxID=2012998 RepID=A0A532V5C2_UNCL8|nr:MAG: hypothetical protein CEE37_01475 [candidate division LCP-89 bacterium B3_LCP]
MAVRNAYILSGVLHLAVIGLILISARFPASMPKQLLRYRPVKLVAVPGKPEPTLVKAAEQPKQAKTEAKPKAKPVQKSIAKKTLTGKAEQKAEKNTPSEPTVGGGSNQLRLEGADFPYPYYLSNIQIKILTNFKPIISSKEAKGLKAVVYFQIDRRGRISDVKLEGKSGHFLFDQEAQRAVLRSNPLPALPPAFATDRLGVHFEFVGSD